MRRPPPMPLPRARMPLSRPSRPWARTAKLVTRSTGAELERIGSREWRIEIGAGHAVNRDRRTRPSILAPCHSQWRKATIPLAFCQNPPKPEDRMKKTLGIAIALISISAAAVAASHQDDIIKMRQRLMDSN